MNTMVMLIRREFWEHRALWLTPLLVAGILVVLAAIGSSFDTGPGMRIEINGQEQQFLDSMTPERRVQMFGILVGGLLLPQLIAMLIVVSIYVLDCLYAERKDRSILFWKSLPVSDTETVTAKFLTAILVVPLLVYALSVATSILCYALLSLRFSSTPFAGLAQWDTLIWLRTQAILLADTLIAALWYAPVVAALLLVSAWARRSVYTWVTLVPLIAMFVERRALGSNHIAQFLGYRLSGFFRTFGVGLERHTGSMPLSTVYERLDVTRLLLNPDLWLGVIAAGALLYATARIRRYRDDT